MSLGDTMIELESTQPTKAFSVSLAPLFTKATRDATRPRPLGFHILGQAALHDGDFKIYRKSKKSKWELYDLSNDPSETNNLASSMPEWVTSMVKAWNQWKSSVEESDGGGDYDL